MALPVKETLYVAILNKSRFDGFYSRLFVFPELPENNDPAWYYLNRIDYTGCLEMVIKLDELFDEKQKEVLLHPDLVHTLVTQCAWCKRYKSASPEGDTWIALPEEEWASWSSVTHGICPDCVSRAKGG